MYIRSDQWLPRRRNRNLKVLPAFTGSCVSSVRMAWLSREDSERLKKNAWISYGFDGSCFLMPCLLQQSAGSEHRMQLLCPSVFLFHDPRLDEYVLNAAWDVCIKLVVQIPFFQYRSSCNLSFNKIHIDLNHISRLKNGSCKVQGAHYMKH